MINFLRIIIYVVIFCGVLWFLSNSEQKQELKGKIDDLVSNYFQFISKDSPIVINEEVIPQKPSEIQINSCAKAKSSEVNHQVVIYEWIDSNGIKKLSDEPPKNGYTGLKVKGIYVDNYFNLKLDSSHARLPAFTQSHVQSGVTKIYKTLVEVINVSELRTVNLNLKFFSDREQFHSYRQKVAPDTGFKTTGFYNSRSNQAAILAVGSKDHITSITLHESTHAIVAAMFGGAPVWLNEGLASFFDRMVITGEQTYKFSTDDQKFQLLRRSRLPSLSHHFSQTPREWYAYNNDDLNYAIDWSLVFFMMINSNRRDFLRGMLEHLAVNDCYGFSTVSYINKHYPRGVSGLELDWINWVKKASSGVITF